MVDVMTSKSNPTIGTVILNWNKCEDLLLCLRSLFAQSVAPDHVLVVDNASSDNSVEQVKKNFPMCELLVHGHNLGGSAGFNSGIRHLLTTNNYDYIQLLDNDVILEPDALEILLRQIASNPKAGMVGSKLLVTNTDSRLQEHGANIDWERYHLNPIGKGHSDSAEYGVNKRVDYVPACSCLIRSSVLSELGLMDEGNFIYWDDIDWGIRFNENNYEVIAVGGSRAWHKMGAATTPSPEITYYFWRNRINFFMRKLRGSEQKKFISYLLVEWHDAVLSTTLLSKKNSRRALIYALVDAWKGVGGKNGRSVRVKEGRDACPYDVLKSVKSIDIVTDEVDKELLNKVQERIYRTFPDIPIRFIGGGQDTYCIYPVHHVLFSELPRKYLQAQKVFLADPYGNIHRFTYKVLIFNKASGLTRNLTVRIFGWLFRFSCVRQHQGTEL